MKIHFYLEPIFNALSVTSNVFRMVLKKWCCVRTHKTSWAWLGRTDGKTPHFACASHVSIMDATNLPKYLTPTNPPPSFIWCCFLRIITHISIKGWLNRIKNASYLDFIKYLQLLFYKILIFINDSNSYFDNLGNFVFFK